MEVLVGPRSYASTAYAIEPTNDASPPSPCLFIKPEEDGGEIRNRLGSDHFLGKSSDESSDSDSSSSIGAPGDSDDDEEDKASSEAPGSEGLASLDALEDSLLIKRGLSNDYIGKLKSFGNLSDVSLSEISVKDLEKPENALNKRRRVLIANKWARRVLEFKLILRWIGV